MQSETLQLLKESDSASCSSVISSYELSPPPLEIMDSSLTSLNWLPEFQIPDINSLVVQKCTQNSDSVFTNTKSEKDISDKGDAFPLSPLRRCMNQTAEFELNPWRYRHDPNKPPFSYTTIIYLAIRSSKNEKVTLGEIYQWIRDHFMYYKIAESTWQNSVRHNLSLNDFFLKIPRSEGDPGKGSFWQINPDYEFILSNEMEFQRLEELQNHQRSYTGQKSKGKGKRRVYSTSSNGGKSNSSQKRRSKSTSSVQVSNNDPTYFPSDLDWATLLNSQRVTCVTCSGIHSCRPLFGSPVLGTAAEYDLSCSPATLPSSLSNRIQLTPLANGNSSQNSLEDLITSQESPGPLLPPWAESRSQSPNTYMLEHPWAESKDQLRGSSNQIWSPDHTTSWSLPLVYPAVSTANTVPVAQLI